MHNLPPHSALSKSQKVGQLFMPAAFINDTEEEVQKLEKLIQEHHIGSLCFFHSRASAATNFEGKKEVVHNENSYDRLRYLIERYQSVATIPLLIAIDAEWGLAMRIENTPQYPYAITLGAMQDQASLVYEVGKGIAMDCRKAGIHWNLSPVVDINLNPKNPVIGYRSFGANKDLVTRYAQAYIMGMKSEGILNSIKHFPGHGDTATDSHLGLPLIAKEKTVLLENELYPFIHLMDDSLDSVMVGHLAVPAIADGKKTSSSVSKEIMTDFLRGELGWEGVIISDALNMHAVSKEFPEKGGVEHAAFEAGNDVLCFADNVAEGIHLISNNSSEERIESSFNRFWKLKEKAFANTSNTLIDGSYEELMKQLAFKSLTISKGDESIIQSFRKNGFKFHHFGKSGGFFENQFSSNKIEVTNNLISIVPRQVKPNNKFGFTDKELETLIELIQNQKSIIYLFGNPFVLNLLPWQSALAVVICYQDLDTFQKNAAAHFKGKVNAQGKLPVSLG
ncbi:glycoside hydrolase family 3 protein [Muricauda sp. DJ-13]|uniref:beta-N-acetylhexosaminidase n=2 Tax=Croceivirga thetidis TaxID=2721623 RepID=A0ABX1GV55_9FLAO|nr:glycoside hydrolase family 3 protein [Croceivirga thetidis]